MENFPARTLRCFLPFSGSDICREIFSHIGSRSPTLSRFNAISANLTLGAKADAVGFPCTEMPVAFTEFSPFRVLKWGIFRLGHCVAFVLGKKVDSSFLKRKVLAAETGSVRPFFIHSMLASYSR